MASKKIVAKDIFNKKSLICIFTGFTSGLPLFILISLLPAWLRSSGLDLKAIGLFALIQFPFTWKFLWAPLFDRFSFAMGRRRGWLIIFQLLLLLTIALAGFINPVSQLTSVAIISIVIAFFSASQDVVIDAYRRELLLDHELGLGNAVHVNAYKIASLIPGSLSLVLADFFAWNFVFIVTALFMLPGIIMTLLVSEPKLKIASPKTLKEAVIEPLKEFKNRKGLNSALMILLFIFLYKIGDSMATALATPFYLDLGFSMTEIGLIAKNAGLWPGIIGGLLGGIWMIKLGINKALWVFGFMQMFATLSFAWLASVGDNNIVLAITVGLEFFAAGLGTTAFVAYIAKTTNPSYTATQFALFTSLASVPRTLTNASTGYLVEFFGWQTFFIFCFIIAIPGMLLLYKIAPWHQSE
ncbi:MAG: AmpG family muropeptide MFS transporter [Proteobacteria bacterium]|jgi:MFS transporter, PAT family, beta-lactamase induction signal transducer AmpG|nr:AmpG family muropeptide MFS transporter [Pseudomonadota bacterium]MDA0873371.1 AmpG family muropeptide MFS transporter [Pseudomonadota bacterium]MDA1134363.1 AmpG family muropeptide MFS transporter [Pseudomonadota bacterium]